MITIKTNIKKTKRFNKKLANLKSKLSEIKKSKIFIGYYNDQGIHQDSGLSYVDLMTIHEYGAPDANIPPRPLLRLTQEGGVFTAEDKTAIKNSFKGVFIKDIPVKLALDKIGSYYENKGKSIFGSSLLEKTKAGNPPLIGDTEMLMDSFSYRTSFTYSIG